MLVKFRFAAADGILFGACVEFFDQRFAAIQWGVDLSPLKPGNLYGRLFLEVTRLADFRTRLLSRGVSVDEPRGGLDGSPRAWLVDPDDNLIELLECVQLAPGHEGIVRSAK